MTEARRRRANGFLNVDLEVSSRKELQELLHALGQGVVILHTRSFRQRHLAAIEVASQRPRTADAVIAEFARIIDSLPRLALRQWKQATSRVFNVGIESIPATSPSETRLSAETVATVARLGGTIVITSYAGP
jgi:hypothetical protein